MEVIKHGINYVAPQEKTCPECKCVFSYVEKDIKSNWVRVTSEDSELRYTYVNCPECGKTIIVNDFRK